MIKKALLVLEDGRYFHCQAFAGSGEVEAEVCFNTSMTGYQEVLTDPSYCEQMVTMTYPLIGNYGINNKDFESKKIQVSALLIKEYSKFFSNFRSQQSLKEYLTSENILGVENLDTRAVTKHLRTQGTMQGILSTKETNIENLLKKIKSKKNINNTDLVQKVTCSKAYRWIRNKPKQIPNLNDNDCLKRIWGKDKGEENLKIVVIDCGVKYSILRYLEAQNMKILVVPASTTSTTIKKIMPDGIVISNGPGNPETLSYLIKCTTSLLGHFPILGICLGHQILGKALGLKTFKLKFGHRGINQPILNLLTQKVEISSQNHGFCIDKDSINNPDIIITHINLNDQTIEGFTHKKYPIISVQHHPEAAPGPNDTKYLFKAFSKLIKKNILKNRHSKNF